MNNRDQVLVEELKNGKEKTLKIFYEEYFALFVSFANSLLPSEEECKDVVHDVFLKYWDCKEDFNNLIAIRAFFYKSIRNTCLNLIRHQQVHQKYLTENLQYLESDDFMHETIMKKEIFHIIHNEIKYLTAMEQKVLLLALDEKSNDQTSLNARNENCANILLNLSYINILVVLCRNYNSMYTLRLAVVTILDSH
ncbi:MAG: sigma-70 family RNA polymerase sigma factor, partial [Butyricimonas sp.]|nr:sigma-70 family RNA polymerase sigma factor [Butyricimonas sp.]